MASETNGLVNYIPSSAHAHRMEWRIFAGFVASQS